MERVMASLSFINETHITMLLQKIALNAKKIS